VRVLMVLCRFVAGGAETTALELVRRLEGRGYEFTVVSVGGGGVLRPAFVRTGADVRDGIAAWRFDPLALFRLARIVRRGRPDVVVCISVPRNAMFYSFIAPAVALRRVPRICWCKSRPGGQSGSFVGALKWYRRLGLLGPIVCASRLQRRMMVERGLGRRHLPLIRNGVDLAKFSPPAPTGLPLPPGKKTIVQVANVLPDKDHATLISAAGMLRRRRDDFHLLLVGRGTDSPEMADAVDHAGLSGAVTLAGHRDDVPAILGAADLFVLSTRGEVSSVSALEAMAAGVPAIVSDIPAFDELIVDGRHGLRVAPGDSEALTDAMDRLLDDDELRSRLIAGASRQAGRFSLARMAGCFDRLFRRVVRN